MGNQNSTFTESDTKSLLDSLDEIASDFITTTHFNDLQNAFDDKYCDKLIVLTEKVLSNKFNLMDLTTINNRIENGKIGYLNKNNISSIQNTNNNQPEKKQLCRQIASFYMRIFMFYDAILKTINPVYIYKDYHATLNMVSFLNRDSIPTKYKEDAKLFSYSICMKRLHRFVIDFMDIVKDNKNAIQYFKVGVKCDTKLNSNSNSKQISLVNEPGIPELKQLYYDIFDVETNEYHKMSEKSETLYKEHISQFYTAFTGKPTIPDDIQFFSDISVSDYCKILPETSVTVDKENPTFQSFASELIVLIQQTKSYEQELLTLLNNMFVKIDNKIMISPDINRVKAEEIIHITKSVVTKMYTSCELQFHKILSIFQVLVMEQFQKNEGSRKQHLNSIKMTTLL
jgi:hypothetical protein